ncbi:hypothetical protein PAXRUDRAFT_10901 [Paxillus rubicundulus Ve08.2h10]|uniref:Uncharacterized protein n=1 Tax=Paxillus rubicundulus Ve08.2h10 TaxID=930991 RepID=A0A0D0E4T9_9AGAM|nr:hypothetical protein PAXRUDRAFT_10901 [Paxillus rubicundulus Ve08.2h10]
MGHREAAGVRDKVKGSNDDWETSDRVNKWRSRNGEAIEDKKGGRASGSVTPSSNDDGGDEDVRHTYIVPKTTQPVPYHISPCPEQRDNDNAMKAYTMAAQGHADIMHNPGGSMDSPGSQPLSVQLEEEKCKRASLYVEPTDVDMDDDECSPNEPTEPPDEKEGGQGQDGKGTPTVKNVEGVEVKGLRQADEPGGRGVKGDEPRGGKGEKRGQREREDGHVLRPPTPLPYDTNQPTHLTNLPHHRRRFKTAPMKPVSKPKPKPDAAETVQGYWWSVPEPPDTRTQGMEAHTLTPCTVDTTRRIQLHQDDAGPIKSVGCIRYAPRMPGECPRPARTQPKGPASTVHEDHTPPLPGNVRRTTNYHIG